VSPRRSKARLALLSLLATIGAAGCAVVPPPSLWSDPRWQDLMRDGELSSRGRVFVPAPILARDPGLVFADEATVTLTSDAGRSRYCPNLSEGFLSGLREILERNTGYDLVLWDPRHPGAEAPNGCDSVLELRVTRYRFELIKTGLGSALASMWFWGLPHLATYYNAPDEVYRCEYRMEATLRPLNEGAPRARRLRGTKELALTDFQRGWTLTSYWPEQQLNWAGATDATQAWEAYGERVEAACEPHARRTLLIELIRFLREPLD
jgi:hypothetical protein